MKKLIWTKLGVYNSNLGFIVQKWEGLVQILGPNFQNLANSILRKLLFHEENY